MRVIAELQLAKGSVHLKQIAGFSVKRSGKLRVTLANGSDMVMMVRARTFYPLNIRTFHAKPRAVHTVYVHSSSAIEYEQA